VPPRTGGTLIDHREIKERPTKQAQKNPEPKPAKTLTVNDQLMKNPTQKLKFCLTAAPLSSLAIFTPVAAKKKAPTPIRHPI
jgi:hypothetical protein